MNIASMKARVIFQKHVVQTDSIGNHLNVWQNYYLCWATVQVSARSTSESEEAGYTREGQRLMFTVRYCAKTADITSTEFRIFFNGHVYNIESVDIMAMHKKSLKFTAVLIS